MKSKRSFTEELLAQQLLEIGACTQCGECLKHCPVQDVTGNPSVSPPEKIRMFREFIRATDGLKSRLFGSGDVDRKLLDNFTRAVYECTTCGACGQSCPVGIFTQRLWPVLRKEMVKRGLGPIGVQANMPKAIMDSRQSLRQIPYGTIPSMVPGARENSGTIGNCLLRGVHRRL